MKNILHISMRKFVCVCAFASAVVVEVLLGRRKIKKKKRKWEEKCFDFP